MPKITFRLGEIDRAIKEVKEYRNGIQPKANKIAKMLAEHGYESAKVTLSGHVFSGETIGSLHIEDYGNGRMALIAASKAIMFFEFGAGVTNGGGHPLNDELGMGPGTYPGKGHWNDPNGWWYYGEDGKKHHTYGNKPHMPMYKASVEMRQEIERIALEVFKT